MPGGCAAAFAGCLSSPPAPTAPAPTASPFSARHAAAAGPQRCSTQHAQHTNKRNASRFSRRKQPAAAAPNDVQLNARNPLAGATRMEPSQLGAPQAKPSNNFGNNERAISPLRQAPHEAHDRCTSGPNAMQRAPCNPKLPHDTVQHRRLGDQRQECRRGKRTGHGKECTSQFLPTSALFAVRSLPVAKLHNTTW